MYDAEVNHQLLKEVSHLRAVLSRWIIFQILVGGIAIGGGFYYVTEQAHQIQDIERSVAFARDQESSLVREIGRLVEKITVPQPLPRSPSGQVLYPGPSAPPKFPEGTRFVPDSSNPKGYRASKD